LNFLPDLATSTPLWLAVTTVGVNAIVGALRASIDDERHWDIVGLSTFGVLMGLGGGFIRDLLVGNCKNHGGVMKLTPSDIGGLRTQISLPTSTSTSPNPVEHTSSF
jgi:hypothetical protein